MNGHAQPMTDGTKPAAVVFTKAVEDLARDHPNDTWASIPKDADLKKGWRHVTYQELAHAVNGVARWAEEHIGAGDGNGVVAYMGQVDDNVPHCLEQS